MWSCETVGELILTSGRVICPYIKNTIHVVVTAMTCEKSYPRGKDVDSLCQLDPKTRDSKI